ncbi:MAG: 50S ribosomal protein L25 [Phycisphaerales bacterium]|nr:MAG: 50S ribosomal protein L25 [Phycisphaerales bacterium]
MHEDAPALPARKRTRVGSRYAKRLRQQGVMPGVVYGHGQDPLSIEFDAHEANLHFAKGERVFRLVLDGDQDEFVLLQDLQFDHLGTNIIHADFRRVDLAERVEVTVPLRFVGQAKGLKAAGAVLVHPVTELDLECAVTNLPDVLEVDISDLDVHDHLTAGQIPLPKATMKLLTPPETVVVSITIKSESESTAEEAQVEASASPEVITEKKKEEQD